MAETLDDLIAAIIAERERLLNAKTRRLPSWKQSR